MLRTCLPAAVAAVFIAAPASASAEVVDTARASGDFASAIASGTAENPGTIKVRITVSPRQRVDVNWNMVCTNDDGGAGSKSGAFRLSRSGTRALKKPFGDATSCTVAAGGNLSRGGRIKVQIVA